MQRVSVELVGQEDWLRLRLGLERKETGLWGQRRSILDVDVKLLDTFLSSGQSEGSLEKVVGRKLGLIDDNSLIILRIDIVSEWKI